MVKGLIACDMDGTLLKENFTISDRNMDALRRAKAAGYLISIFSGRTAQIIIKHLPTWGLDNLVDIVSGGNGAQYYDVNKKGEIDNLGYITPACVEEFLKLAGDEEFGFAWYNETTYWTNRKNKRVGTMASQMGLDIVYLEEDEIVANFPERWSKVIVFLHDYSQRYIKEKVDALKTQDFDLVFSNDLFLEIIPKGINKSSAITEACKRYDLKKEQVMAIGDHENDIAMIVASGFGVAMGNAVDLVKENADYITADIDNDGVAQAIDRFMELQEGMK